MGKQFKLQTLLDIAIFAALAMFLDLIPSIKPHPSISISFAMIPIFIIAFRWGVRAAFISGFIWGILQIALGDAWILTPLQAFIEYFIAFAFIGFAGLFSTQIKRALRTNNKKTATFYIVIAVIIGSAARYFWHLIVGVVFFSEYAFEAGQGPIIFSLIANGITFTGATITCSILLILLITTAPHLITSAKTEK